MFPLLSRKISWTEYSGFLSVISHIQVGSQGFKALMECNFLATYGRFGHLITI